MTRIPTMRRGRRGAGIALPVVLVILALMLIGGVYLLKAIHSTGLTTGNLAYDATLSREADRGLHEGFRWLSTTAQANRPALDSDDLPNGYHAGYNAGLQPRDGDFWLGKKTISDGEYTIDYVIHRMCSKAGPYDDPSVSCTQTAANTSALGNSSPLGTSQATDTPQYAGAPRIHYVITARISGGRGARVMNQMIVLIGA